MQPATLRKLPTFSSYHVHFVRLLFEKSALASNCQVSAKQGNDVVKRKPADQRCSAVKSRPYRNLTRIQHGKSCAQRSRADLLASGNAARIGHRIFDCFLALALRSRPDARSATACPAIGMRNQRSGSKAARAKMDEHPFEPRRGSPTRPRFRPL